MHITETISNFFTTPLNSAKKGFAEAKDKKAYSESYVLRARVVTQVVSSVIALKLLFWTGLAEIGYNYLTNQDWKRSLADAMIHSGTHAVLAFGSAVATVAPSNYLAKVL